MYGLFTYMYHTFSPNVGKYTTHWASGNGIIWGSAEHVRVLGHADPPRWGLAAKVARFFCSTNRSCLGSRWVNTRCKEGLYTNSMTSTSRGEITPVMCVYRGFLGVHLGWGKCLFFGGRSEDLKTWTRVFHPFEFRKSIKTKAPHDFGLHVGFQGVNLSYF